MLKQTFIDNKSVTGITLNREDIFTIGLLLGKIDLAAAELLSLYGFQTLESIFPDDVPGGDDTLLPPSEHTLMIRRELMDTADSLRKIFTSVIDEAINQRKQGVDDKPSARDESISSSCS